MGLFDNYNSGTKTGMFSEFSPSGSSGGLFGKPQKIKKPSIKTDEDLANYARSVGLTAAADRFDAKPKLSLLQRLGRGLNALETGDAIYRARYEDASFGKTYLKDIGKGVGSLFTGKDYRLTPKKTFKDIMLKEGMKDRPGKLDLVDVTGLAADIIFDPTTWFGGLMGKGIKKAGGAAFKTAEKIPKIGKYATASKEGIEGLFKPFAALRKSKKGEEAYEAINKFYKGKRAAMDEFESAIHKQARDVYKAIGKKEYKRLSKMSGEAVEGGFKTGNELFDNLLNTLVENQKAMAKQLVDNGQITTSMANYMHHALTPEAEALISSGTDVMGFIKPMLKGSGLGKARKYKGTVKEINKIFKKKFGHDLFEEDAIKAFTKSGLKSIHDLHVHDLKRTIGTQFGKQFDEKLLNTIDPTTGLKWVESGIKGLEDKLIPAPIEKDINKTVEIFASDEATKGFLRAYDKINNFWKATVTGYFPAFHTRNGIGGVFNNFIAGLNDPRVYKHADDILKGKTGKIILKNGDELTYEAIRKLMKEHGITGQTGIFDVAENLRKGVEDGALKRGIKYPQQVMGWFEDHLRVPLFIDTLKKSGAKNLDDAALEASKKVIKYHFDYMPEGFTAFEKNVMKRIIPFYTWTRHNVPLQLEQMIMQPGKYAGVMKAQRAFGNKPSSEEEQYLPRWLKERFTAKGESGYWSGFGLPMSEATEKVSAPLRGFGMSLSPFIKTPIEALTGYNIFKEKRIDDDLYGKYYRNAPKPLKDLLQMHERKSKDGKIYYTVNPRRKYWLEVIGSRGLNTALRIMNGLQPEDRKELWSVITTIKKYDYDIEDLKKWSDSDKRKQLEKELLMAGQLAQYTNRYVPNNLK